MVMTSGRLELPLASRVPTCEVQDSVVLNVDGSMAVCFEVQPLEHTGIGSAQVATAARSMSELLRWLPDGTVLQLLVDIVATAPLCVQDFIREREFEATNAARAAADLCVDVARHTQQQRFRTVRQYLFVSQPYHFQNAVIVRAGTMPLTRPNWSAERFAVATRKLTETAQAVAEQGRAAGLGLRLAQDSDILALIQTHLNPNRDLPCPSNGRGVDPTLAFADARHLDPSRTLRERLCHTHFEIPSPRHLVVGDQIVRTLTVKELPDSTFAGMLAPLFFELAAPCRVSISAEKLPSHTALAGLKVRRSMSHAIATLSARRNIDAEVQHQEIESLMEALSSSGACLCATQVSVALVDRGVERLEERVSQVEQTFARAGGFSTLVEDYNHLDVYLSMLPGAAHRFRRSRTVQDANAAHMLLPFGAWRGTGGGPMLLKTRAGDAVPFDPFSDELPAFNGLVVGASGSGKSFFTNLLLANHLAAGGGAVVVDIGGSYRRLTELFGGTYIDVGAPGGMGLNPLPSFDELNALPTEARETRLQFLAGLLELLMTEDGEMPTSERALVAKALSSFYAKPWGKRDRAPTLAELQRFLQSFGETEDNAAALRLVQRLDLWTAGPRARLFDRPIELSLAAGIIAIDLKALEGDKELQAVALYVLSLAIWSKLSAEQNRRQTLVVFDECWALLSNPPAARLIENLVRTSRKYGAGLWCLSQSADDFVGSTIGPALLSNSFVRVLLRHAFDHERVAKIFGLTDHGEAAFRALTSKRGEYAEAFLQFGNRAEMVQVSPSPLGYWMATTSAKDRDAERMVRQKNLTAPLINLLGALAERFPKGM